MNRLRLTQIALEYARRSGGKIFADDRIGFGAHGIVFAFQPKDHPVITAVKVHEQMEGYQHERDVYLRLRSLGITSIRGHAVPKLLNYDDELHVLVMTVVHRPFVLDFAGAYLDQAPEFSPEVVADWRQEKAEEFEHHWPAVQAILAELRRHGIYVLDVNPGNVAFDEESEQ